MHFSSSSGNGEAGSGELETGYEKEKLGRSDRSDDDKRGSGIQPRTNDSRTNQRAPLTQAESNKRRDSSDYDFSFRSQLTFFHKLYVSVPFIILL